MTVVVPSDYGWRGDGKSADEIAGDIEHTRHRLDADLRDLRARLIVPKRIAPFAAVALAAVAFVVRRAFRKRR